MRGSIDGQKRQERRPSLVKTATIGSSSPIGTPTGRESPSQSQSGEWTPKSASPGARPRSMEGFEEWTAKSLREAEVMSMDGSTPIGTPKSGSRTPNEGTPKSSGSGSPQLAPREAVGNSLGTLALQRSVTADILQRREELASPKREGRASVVVDGKLFPPGTIAPHCPTIPGGGPRLAEVPHRVSPR